MKKVLSMVAALLLNVCWLSANRRLFKNQMEKCNGCIPARSTCSSRMDMWKRLSNKPIKQIISKSNN